MRADQGPKQFANCSSRVVGSDLTAFDFVLKKGQAILPKPALLLVREPYEVVEDFLPCNG